MLQFGRERLVTGTLHKYTGFQTHSIGVYIETHYKIVLQCVIVHCQPVGSYLA
jgi:hypothetical protein